MGKREGNFFNRKEHKEHKMIYNYDFKIRARIMRAQILESKLCIFSVCSVYSVVKNPRFP